jgi:signal transduction histidine kinase
LNLLSSQIALDMDKAKMFNQLGSTNQKLGELSSKLASFDQGKTDFLSIASHELRTPLTHIHGYASMLLEATEEELQNPAYLQHVFNGIAKGSNRLKGVMDLIFDVSRADIGELHLSLGPVSIKDVVQTAAERESETIVQRQHKLILSGLDQLPIVTGDMKRLVQALTHLLNNAVKYTPDNGTITVNGLTGEDEGKPFVEIIISDTGIGINPEDHEKIFEKYYRVGNV